MIESDQRQISEVFRGVQLAFVLSLGLFGVEGARAILAATALQVFGFAPLVVVGLAIVLLSSSSLLIRRA